jgi:Flp pilus assembly protein TadD
VSRRKRKRKDKAPPDAVAASTPSATGTARLPSARRTRQVFALLATLGLVGMLAYQNVLVPRRHLEALPRPDLATAEAPVADKVRKLLEAVRRNPSTGPAWGRLAINLDVHDFKPEAVSCYRKAAELEPDEFLWSYFGALALDDVGSEEALEWFGRSLELRGDYAPLHIHHGRARLQAGRVDEAKASFEEALRLDPEAVFARLGMGQILVMRGDLEASRRHLRAAVESAPRFREAYGLLAEVHRRQGDIETVTRLRSMLPRLPDKNPIPDPIVETQRNREGVSAYWCDVRGQAYMAAGQAGKAVEAFEAAIAARPGTPDFRNRLGAALVQAGQPEEAIGSFRKALELAPGYAQAYVNLGGALVATGRLSEGLATLREGLEQAPEDTKLLHALAWILATAPDGGVRDGGEAVSMARRLVTLKGGDDPIALDVLAAAYAAAGRFEEAEARARRAAVLAEGAPVAGEIEARLELYEKRRPYVSRAFAP